MTKLKSIVFVAGVMSRQKARWAFLLFLLVLVALSLVGCQSGEDFPVYQMETREDYTEILSIDGIQYQRNLSGQWDEQAHYYSGGSQYVWTPAEGIGEQIGVCGKDTDKGGGFGVYEIAGDENRAFLYTAPQKFYSGGLETRLWMQEGVTLGKPTAEMLSSVTLFSENEDSTPVQVNASAMIAALLEAYNGDSVQGLTGESWERGSLIMHHKDFPFLQYEIEYRCSPEQEIAYCSKNEMGEWFVLPDEWYSVISEHGFPTRGK